MKIGIVGSGAMGSVYGGLFTAAGNEVWLIDIWPEHIEAIRKHGLAVSGASGERVVRPRASTDPAEAGVCELVVLATKMRDLETATRSARPMIGQGTDVLTIQNGLGNAEMLERVLGNNGFLQGIAGGFGASIKAPGQVHHNGMDQLNIAEAAGGLSDRLKRVVAAWQKAGFRATAHDDPGPMIWSKYICNLAFSPTCAIAGLRIGQVLDNPKSCAIAEACASEGFAVARKKGIRLPYTDPVARIHEFGRVIPNAMPSMMLDLIAGRRSEVDALNRALAREAERVGVPAPMNGFVATLVEALEIKHQILGVTYGTA